MLVPLESRGPGLCSLQRLSGENLFFASSDFWGLSPTLAHGCIAPILASVGTLSSFLCMSNPLLLLGRMHVMAFRAHQIIQDKLSISKCLI